MIKHYLNFYAIIMNCHCGESSFEARNIKIGDMDLLRVIIYSLFSIF